MMRAEIEKAIATIEDSRHSHVTWIQWYDEEPAREAEHASTCGDRAHHVRCIDGYDHAIAVLRSCLTVVSAIEPDSENEGAKQ